MKINWKDILSTEKKEERKEIHKFPGGTSVYRQNRSLIVMPPSKEWRAISSGNFNGGFMSSPSAIFNTTSLGGKAEYDMMGQNRESLNQYSSECAKLVGLDPKSTIGLGTAAHMDNASIGSYSSNGIEVSSVITGGIRGNGGRAGDPAYYDEMEKVVNKNGTIVIILIIDANLSDNTLLESMMTATEAKSRVIERMMAKSLYSNGIATGSGTDQITVICNKESNIKIDNLGDIPNLSMAITQCIEKTLADALDRQSMMNLITQCNPYTMISRYNITEIDCHNEIRYPFQMKTLLKGVKKLSEDPNIATIMIAVTHIMDEMRWKLISTDEGTEACRKIICLNIKGPSMKDPVLKKRLDTADDVYEIIKLGMAMMLYDIAYEIVKEGTL